MQTDNSVKDIFTLKGVCSSWSTDVYICQLSSLFAVMASFPAVN